MSRSTHGGGVVFKLTSEGPRYLLVEASGTRDRWVFPKGHVENGETAAIAALREVTEEAGVRARAIRRLQPVEHKKEGERISIVYFLMAYAGRTTPLEKRRVRWLTFDEAIGALDLGKSRRVLRSADRLISLATGEEPPHHRIRRAAARLAEWLVLGALVLLLVVPIPPLAALLVPPAGMLAGLAMRALLRPLEGLASGDDDVALPPGDDQLRLLIGGAEWMTRTDYLGGPVRIAAALAVLLPGVPASGGSWVAPGGLALAALLSWVMTRKGRRQLRSRVAVLLRAPALWLAFVLAAHSIATAGSALGLVAAFLSPRCPQSPGGGSSVAAPASSRRLAEVADEARVLRGVQCDRTLVQGLHGIGLVAASCNRCCRWPAFRRVRPRIGCDPVPQAIPFAGGR